MMLAVLDILLTAIHSAVVLFLLTGWAIPRLRRAHLAVALLTAFSWLALAPWYGLGYCFLTDWAWMIKRARGAGVLPDSFIEYGLERLTGRDWDSALVYYATAAIGATVLALSVKENKTRFTGASRSQKPKRADPR